MRDQVKTSRTLIVFFVFLVNNCFAQQAFFSNATAPSFTNSIQKRIVRPNNFRTVNLDQTSLRSFLQTVPAQVPSNKTLNKNAILDIPMPKGDTAKFFIWESSAMAPDLAAQYPEIRSYTGQGITDATATIKIDWTEFGFHAMILSPVSGSVFIDPYAQGNTGLYISYFKQDLVKSSSYVEPPPIHPITKASKVNTNSTLAGQCMGASLYTFRLAVACTHEYAAAATGIANPTFIQTLSAVNTTINRVNGIYEKEISVSLILVASESKILFTNAATDPFTGNNNAYTLIDESQQVIDSAIGTNNYDIGHTFSTGGGGYADVAVVCQSSLKASGITGSSTPSGDGYDIDYVAHEMGHQFGANHPFNSVLGACDNVSRNSATAYEPGSGNTIMAYAGICLSDDIQPNSDAFFHAVNFDEISSFLVNDAGCATVTNTGNTLPQITSMSNNGVSIPLNTPFILNATAADINGDALTYSWEEWDLGPSGAWNSGATTTSAPLFKARTPKISGSRTFPDMAVILAGYPTNPAGTTNGLKGEVLPAVARLIKFHLTVRDNNSNGGGIVSGGSGCQAGFTNVFQINAVATSGPFLLTAPNGGEVLGANTIQTITWNPAGTAAAPISCSTVTIQLSTDGGNTYPLNLITNTANDGSQQVQMPALTSSAARIRIMADNNVFFDISDNNFTISGPYITKANGNWNSPATWLSGVVPTAGVNAIVHHTVTVTANASCYSLIVEPPAGSIQVNSGVRLTITH
ncbi:MAG: reprolysin-like metallopeptidase [Ferruginibacter sp.]